MRAAYSLHLGMTPEEIEIRHAEREGENGNVAPLLMKQWNRCRWSKSREWIHGKWVNATATMNELNTIGYYDKKKRWELFLIGIAMEPYLVLILRG